MIIAVQSLRPVWALMAAVPHSDDVLAVGDVAAAAALAISLLPAWAGLQPSQVSVTVITGGITNSLLKLEPLDDRLAPVLLRVFGLNTEVLIERARELKVLLQLNAAGFGATVLATFTNGRLEAWLPARPLAPGELGDAALSPAIARLVARFHAAAVDEPRAPQLWPRLRTWLATARELVLPDAAKQAKLERLVDWAELQSALDEVQRACDSLASPTVYCHNDLLAPNFLLQQAEGEPQLHLIDFEYGAYGPRGYDIANHFCEWAGFECDYQRYPSEAQQRAFCAAYLAQAGEERPGAIEALLLEVQVYSLASHLFWGIWSLIQARYSQLDFDYLDYHLLRLDKFRLDRQRILATARAGLNHSPAPAAAGERAFWSTPRLLEARARLMPANVALTFAKAPLHIVRGRGQHLYDAEGEEYLDCVNNVCHVGHCHPDVVEAVTKQVMALNTNSRYLHSTLLEAASLLTASLPPPLSVVMWVNSGSEANDLALRLARAHTGGRGVLVVGGAYHGHVTSMIDASPYKFERTGGTGLRSYVRQTLTPDVFSGRFRGSLDDEALSEAYAADARAQLASFARQAKCEAARRAQLRARAEALRKAAAMGGEPAGELQAELEDVMLQLDDDGLTAHCGAFFCESILSCGGQIVPPAGYLRRVHAAVRAAGGVCVADEVQVGFGRVGAHAWGFQLQGPDVVPDIVTMGKPVGNGYPVALVATTPAIAASFAAAGMEYFNTFGGNPPAAAAALATMRALQSEGLQEAAAATGEVLRHGFLGLQEAHACIGSVRGVGLMQGLEFILPETRGLDGARTPWPEAASAVVYAMRARRILLSVDGMAQNVMKLKPPMVFGADDAARVLRELGEVLGDLEGALEAYRRL